MNYRTYEVNLKDSTYPGRGIVIGMTPDGENIAQVYWIMGRSVNSRNRVFETEGRFMRTKAHDEALLTDPSLVIYYPIKNLKGLHIVTNGDQTETIYEYISNGRSFEDALNTREYEPDPPNYTPRISGMVNLDCMNYKMSILKTVDNDASLGQRNFYQYEKFIKGIGHCITTYDDDGNPLPSFSGEPYKVELYNSIEETTRKFWDYLDTDNRVSLAVKFINCKTGKSEIKIVNKNV